MKGRITDVLKTIALRYLYTDSVEERDAIIAELKDFVTVLENEDDFRARSGYKIAKNIVETLRESDRNTSDQTIMKVLEERFDPELLEQITQKLRTERVI
jgi:hypothetical protein